MKLTHLTGVLLLSTLQVACTSYLPERLARADIKTMQGAWYSQGYGYAFNLTREHLDLYTVADQTCYREDYSLTELAYDFPHMRFVSPEQIELGETVNDKAVAFKKVTALPLACTEPPDTSPVSVTKAFGDILKTHYPFFELHGVDWKKRTATLNNNVGLDSSDETLAQSLFAALEGISDSHLGVLASIDGKRKGQSRRTLRHLDKYLKPIYNSEPSDVSYHRYRREWISDLRSRAVSTVLGDAFESAADGKLVWGRIGDVGYLQVKQFLGYSNSDSERSELKRFSHHLDQILTELADTESLIIDVSLSRGGYGSLAFELASRFAAASMPEGKQNVLVHKHYKHVVGLSDMREEYLYPTKRVAYKRPVFVVSSDATTSAAEEFLMAMRVQKHVTLMGLPSNGSLSDVLEKTLPNGWLLITSHEAYLSPDDELFEKVGVPVDIAINLFRQPDASESYLQGLLEIVGRVKRQ